MRQVLNRKGELVGESDLTHADDQLLALYEKMVLARTLDRKLAAMNLQGRIGSYYKMEGQEAHVGAAMAMGEGDFLFPAYREMGMWLECGLPLESVVRLWIGAADYQWNSIENGIAMLCATIGTQMPHATGYAYGAAQLGRDQVVVCVLGDGATSTPDFHAALNFAGVWKSPIVFLCQNNQWAEETPISKQTGSDGIAVKGAAYGMPGMQVDGMDPLAVHDVMKEAIKRARAGEGPSLVEMLTYRYSPHMVSAIDPRPPEEQAYWHARDPLVRVRLYLEGRGLLSEERVKAIELSTSEQVETTVAKVDAAEAAEGLPGTEYLVRNVYEKVPPFLLEQVEEWCKRSGQPAPVLDSSEILAPVKEVLPEGPTEKWCIREALNAALHEAMEKRPNTVVLGEDVALVGGQFRVSEGLLEKYGEGRVVDTPLCEIGIIGSAVGMAMAGMRPVAEIMFAGFTYTALDNIIGHVGRWRYRYQGERGMPMVIRLGHGSGVGGHEFHIDSPEAYFMHTPGLTVVMPSNPVDAKGMMTAALASEDPVVFFEPMLLYNAPRAQVPTESYTVPLGKAKVVDEGTDVTVLAYGNMVAPARQAAKKSSASVEVIDLRTIKPWDQQTVLASVEKTGRLVVVSETTRTGGVAADIAATVAQRALYSLQAPIQQVTPIDAPRPIRKLEQLVLIGATHITQAIDEVLTF